MNKKEFKKSPTELQEYLKFKKRGFAVEPKKGKGSTYKRQPKHKNKVIAQEEDENERSTSDSL